MRKHLWFWLNIALIHGIVIFALWFPQPLHFPTRADVVNALHNSQDFFDRHLHPEQYAQRERDALAAAQKRIAELPPALITRASPLNKVYQIRCPADTRAARLHGSVFLVADISAQGVVRKATVVEPSPNAVINQSIVHNFSQAKFKPAMDEHNLPAPDQIHFTWDYDCRR